MKIETQTPEEELVQRIANYKKEYLKNVRMAKLSCKFKKSTIEEKAKMIKAINSGDDKDAIRRMQVLYNSSPIADRKKLFDIITKKAVVKGRIQSGSYLSLSNLSLSKEHYSIVLTHPTIKHVFFRFPDERSKMTFEQADKIAKAYFPGITKIEWQ